MYRRGASYGRFFHTISDLLQPLIYRQLLQMPQGKNRGNANENTCSGTGNRKNRQIQHDFDIFNHHAGHHKLAEIMKNATGSTDSDQAEPTGPLQQRHGQQAEKGPGNTV